MDQDFRLGPWVIRPSLNGIVLNGVIARLEPRAMEVLVCLAEHAGDVVSKEKLIGAV
jgi:DNA-binding winged helix-turn-helix (wHTH) protein